MAKKPYIEVSQASVDVDFESWWKVVLVTPSFYMQEGEYHKDIAIKYANTLALELGGLDVKVTE